MKRMITMLLILFALLVLLAVMAATGMAEGPDAMVQEPFSWDYLGTIAGATAFVVVLVQVLKVPLDKVWRIPTRVFVYLVSAVVLLLATAFTTGLTADNALLACVNAFVVALAAYGAYEISFAKLNK